MRSINLKFNSCWFGNQLFVYAFAKAYAEREGFRLHVRPDWTGARVFQLDDPPVEKDYEEVGDMDFPKWEGRSDITIVGYAQNQMCLNYTRSWAKSLYVYRDSVASILSSIPTHEICAHIRYGDYLITSGFVPISKESYVRAANKFGVDPEKIHYVQLESPYKSEELIARNMDFLPDFYQLTQAKTLFRGNSTYSWWAATLGNADRVFAPRIDNVVAVGDGKIYDVEFEEGNHPRCAAWEFITDLHIEP